MGKGRLWSLRSRRRRALLALLAGPLCASAWLCQRAPRPTSAESSLPGHVEARQPNEGERASAPVMAPAAQRAELDPLRLSGIVQSSGGSLLAGAHVCLLRGPALGGGASACVRSDAAGRFTLESLPDGEWPTLSASADGYLSLRQTLAADRQTPLVLRLEPGGVRVSGTVLDAAGGPISGALVSAGRAGEQGSALVLTSNTGNFAMTVPAGTTRLWARAEGYSQLAREVEAPAQQVQLLLSAASFLRGHVLVEATRQPAAGVEVTVLDAGGTGIEARSATTDEHGRFQLEELPAGAYSVGARSEGWRSAERLLVLETADEQDLELLVRPASRLRGSVRAGAAICNRGVVTLEGPVASTQAVDARGSVEFTALLPGEYRVVVSCDLGMTLSETIVIGAEPVTRDWELEPGLSVTGMATTFAGAPLAGAQIEIQPLGEPPTRERVVCRSDAQGAFACFGLQAGQYACQLNWDAMPRGDSVRVVLGEGSAAPEIALRADPTASLRVRIEQAGALQLDAVSVLARREDGSELLGQRAGDVFLFEQLPLGAYEVRIDPALPGGQRRVEVTQPDGQLEISLSGLEARTLQGRVLDEHGNGVPDVWVRVASASLYGPFRPASPVLSDRDGGFEIAGLLPGAYELSARGKQGEAHLEEIRAEGRPLTVTLREPRLALGLDPAASEEPRSGSAP